MLDKIRKKIKTKKDFDSFVNNLLIKVKSNEPISDNPMLDGLIVGFIVSTHSFTLDLLLDKEMGNVLDGTLQKLEQIAIWMNNNENALCNLN